MADAIFKGMSPDKPRSSRSRSTERNNNGRSRSPQSPSGLPLVSDGRPKESESWWKSAFSRSPRGGSDERRAGETRPPKPPRTSSREVIADESSSWTGTASRALASAKERCLPFCQKTAAQAQERYSALTLERKVAVVASVAGVFLVMIGLGGMMHSAGAHRGRASQAGHLRQHGRGHGHGAALDLEQCSDMVPCPLEWRQAGNAGGFYCMTSGGCRPFDQGRFPTCTLQCQIGVSEDGTAPRAPSTAGADSTVIVIQGGASAEEGEALMPLTLKKEGAYDLRVVKGGKLLGCAAPIGLFPGQPKYGCAGNYSTAQTCDAANFPIKDTKYVAAVHQGCETEQGRGTYGYAYDDGVGLKQCAPVTKYEWVLCPKGNEGPIQWEAESGPNDSTKRFRVTNRCDEAIWIQQAGAKEALLEHDDGVVKIAPYSSHTYSIPNRGLPSTRFLPKTGCDADGNACDIQSMPPCPAQGCDLPVDTKFESSWGCVHATGVPEKDRMKCALTGQGNPSTYQDWWDGSAVDGWTLPFSVLVDDAGHGLAPGDTSGSPAICGPVVCANLVADKLCPKDEYLTPVD